MTVLDLMKRLAAYDAGAPVYFANYDDMGITGYGVASVAHSYDHPSEGELLVEHNAIILDKE